MFHTDPTGEALPALAAALIGAAIGAGAYTAGVALSEGGFDNWNWGHFLIVTAAGAATNAASGYISSKCASRIGQNVPALSVELVPVISVENVPLTPDDFYLKIFVIKNHKDGQQTNRNDSIKTTYPVKRKRIKQS